MDYDILRSLVDPSIGDKTFEMVKSISNAPYAKFNGVEVVSIKPEEVILKMNMKDKMNSVGFAHGGAHFVLADCVFAFAANLNGEDQITLGASIQYHRPGFGDELVAVSTKISETKTTSLYMVKIFCDEKHLSTVMITGFKVGQKKKELEETLQKKTAEKRS